MTIAAFFEDHRMDESLQERYYKWWFDWAQDFVSNDPNLKAFVGDTFEHYPYGQHAAHAFHLNGKAWATALSDLGDFIRDAIFPELDEGAIGQLESEHAELLRKIEAAAAEAPPPGVPEVGYFRHV
jgi:hypothetical protein